MREDTYTYSAIGSKTSLVRVNSSLKGISGFDISINDSCFTNDMPYHIPDRLRDLIDVAVAVYMADRFTFDDHDRSYLIRVDMPIRDPEYFQGAMVDKIKESLRFFTGAEWDFIFKRREPEANVQQSIMEQSYVEQDALEISLWSGGLDALAGLKYRIKEGYDKNRILFSIGTNNNVISAQNKCYELLKGITKKNINIARFRINSTNQDGMTQNKYQRTRGFLYMILGSIYAYLNNQNKLFVFENGIGAINLYYNMSQSGLDHSRSVHPIGLIYISELITFITEDKFEVVNPFIYKTKAEMCSALSNFDIKHILPRIITCDSLHRSKGDPIQCGWCSSCLLRKQALLCNGIVEENLYVIDNKDTQYLVNHRMYLDAMLHQIDILDNALSGDFWNYMSKNFPILVHMIYNVAEYKKGDLDSLKDSIKNLYATYTQEWRNIAWQVNADFDSI